MLTNKITKRNMARRITEREGKIKDSKEINNPANENFPLRLSLPLVPLCLNVLTFFEVVALYF